MRRHLPVLIACVVLAGCGGQSESPSAADSSDPGVVHVHGLGRNPADGALIIATHTGLFRVAGAGDPERVAGLYQDTMGFTIVGPDHFLGSGHPGTPGNDPPFLGLIESRDAGRSWDALSLRGDVDFHVLEAAGRTVYGYGSDFDSQQPRFLRSDDGGRTWTRLGEPEGLVGLAIDPEDERHVIALGERRGYESRDGGARWRPLDVPGGLVTWTRSLGVLAIDGEGVVRRAPSPRGRWERVGRIDGSPAAFEASGSEVLAATHESAILRSGDGGRTWDTMLSR